MNIINIGIIGLLFIILVLIVVFLICNCKKEFWVKPKNLIRCKRPNYYGGGNGIFEDIQHFIDSVGVGVNQIHNNGHNIDTKEIFKKLFNELKNNFDVAIKDYVLRMYDYNIIEDFIEMLRTNIDPIITFNNDTGGLNISDINKLIALKCSDKLSYLYKIDILPFINIISANHSNIKSVTEITNKTQISTHGLYFKKYANTIYNNDLKDMLDGIIANKINYGGVYWYKYDKGGKDETIEIESETNYLGAYQFDDYGDHIRDNPIKNIFLKYNNDYNIDDRFNIVKENIKGIKNKYYDFASTFDLLQLYYKIYTSKQVNTIINTIKSQYQYYQNNMLANDIKLKKLEQLCKDDLYFTDADINTKIFVMGSSTSSSTSGSTSGSTAVGYVQPSHVTISSTWDEINSVLDLCKKNSDMFDAYRDKIVFLPADQKNHNNDLYHAMEYIIFIKNQITSELLQSIKESKENIEKYFKVSLYNLKHNVIDGTINDTFSDQINSITRGVAIDEPLCKKINEIIDGIDTYHNNISIFKVIAENGNKINLTDIFQKINDDGMLSKINIFIQNYDIEYIANFISSNYGIDKIEELFDKIYNIVILIDKIDKMTKFQKFKNIQTNFNTIKKQLNGNILKAKNTKNTKKSINQIYNDANIIPNLKKILNICDSINQINHLNTKYAEHKKNIDFMLDVVNSDTNKSDTRHTQTVLNINQINRDIIAINTAFDAFIPNYLILIGDVNTNELINLDDCISNIAAYLAAAESSKDDIEQKYIELKNEYDNYMAEIPKETYHDIITKFNEKIKISYEKIKLVEGAKATTATKTKKAATKTTKAKAKAIKLPLDDDFSKLEIIEKTQELKEIFNTINSYKSFCDDVDKSISNDPNNNNAIHAKTYSKINNIIVAFNTLCQDSNTEKNKFMPLYTQWCDTTKSTPIDFNEYDTKITKIWYKYRDKDDPNGNKKLNYKIKYQIDSLNEQKQIYDNELKQHADGSYYHDATKITIETIESKLVPNLLFDDNDAYLKAIEMRYSELIKLINEKITQIYIQPKIDEYNKKLLDDKFAEIQLKITPIPPNIKKIYDDYINGQTIYNTDINKLNNALVAKNGQLIYPPIERITKLSNFKDKTDPNYIEETELLIEEEPVIKTGGADIENLLDNPNIYNTTSDFYTLNNYLKKLKSFMINDYKVLEEFFIGLIRILREDNPDLIPKWKTQKKYKKWEIQPVDWSNIPYFKQKTYIDAPNRTYITDIYYRIQDSLARKELVILSSDDAIYKKDTSKMYYRPLTQDEIKMLKKRVAAEDRALLDEMYEIDEIIEGINSINPVCGRYYIYRNHLWENYLLPLSDQ